MRSDIVFSMLALLVAFLTGATAMQVAQRWFAPDCAPAATYSELACAHYQAIGQGWKCQ